MASNTLFPSIAGVSPPKLTPAINLDELKRALRIDPISGNVGVPFSQDDLPELQRIFRTAFPSVAGDVAGNLPDIGRQFDLLAGLNPPANFPPMPGFNIPGDFKGLDLSSVGDPGQAAVNAVQQASQNVAQQSDPSGFLEDPDQGRRANGNGGGGGRDTGTGGATTGAGAVPGTFPNISPEDFAKSFAGALFNLLSGTGAQPFGPLPFGDQLASLIFGLQQPSLSQNVLEQLIRGGFPNQQALINATGRQFGLNPDLSGLSGGTIETILRQGFPGQDQTIQAMLKLLQSNPELLNLSGGTLETILRQGFPGQEELIGSLIQNLSTNQDLRNLSGGTVETILRQGFPGQEQLIQSLLQGLQQNPDLRNLSGGTLETILRQGFPGQENLVNAFQNLFTGPVSPVEDPLTKSIISQITGGGLSPDFVGAARERILGPSREQLLGQLNQRGILDSGMRAELERRLEADFNRDLLLQSLGAQERAQALGLQATGLPIQRFGAGLQGFGELGRLGLGAAGAGSDVVSQQLRDALGQFGTLGQLGLGAAGTGSEIVSQQLRDALGQFGTLGQLGLSAAGQAGQLPLNQLQQALSQFNTLGGLGLNAAGTGQNIASSQFGNALSGFQGLNQNALSLLGLSGTQGLDQQRLLSDLLSGERGGERGFRGDILGAGRQVFGDELQRQIQRELQRAGLLGGIFGNVAQSLPDIIKAITGGGNKKGGTDISGIIKAIASIALDKLPDIRSQLPDIFGFPKGIDQRVIDSIFRSIFGTGNVFDIPGIDFGNVFGFPGLGGTGTTGGGVPDFVKALRNIFRF